MVRTMMMRWVVSLTLGLALLLVGVQGAAAAPDLSGSWIMLQIYPRIAELPVVGESRQTSFVVQRVDIQQEGLSLIMTDQYCFTVIEESSPLASTEIPEAFMSSLIPGRRVATLEDQDGTIAFEQPRYTEIRGATLTEPETEDLPTEPEDPRVIDQDGDGFPGMTVNVNIFGLFQAQIYVVQRVQYALSGTVLSGDRIEGLIQWQDEQNTLAATSPLLLAAAESAQDPDPTQHRFVMLRAQEEWTCEWLMESWQQVFGLAPVEEED